MPKGISVFRVPHFLLHLRFVCIPVLNFYTTDTPQMVYVVCYHHHLVSQDCGFYLFTILTPPYSEKSIQFFQFRLFFVNCCSLCSRSLNEPFAQPTLVAGRERKTLQVAPKIV